MTQSDDIEEDSINSIGSYANHYYSFEAITFFYEHKIYLTNFQNQINSTGDLKFSQPSYFISIGSADEHIVSQNYQLFGYYLYSFHIPQEITINDTTQQRIRGYNFKFSIAGQGIINRKHYQAFLTEGINTGRLKLINNEREKLKNPIVSPYIGLVLRATFGGFTFFTIAQFDYDLSSKKWKKLWFSDRQKIGVPGLKQHGLTLSFGINYSPNGYYSR